MEKITKTPSYLRRVGTKYHFRYAFPKKYCNVLAGEIRVSLKTGNIYKARLLSSMLARRTRDFIETKGAYMAATQQEIKAALGAYLRAILDLNDLKRIEGKDPFEMKGIAPITMAELAEEGMSELDPYAKVPGKDILRLNAIAIRDQLLSREHYSEADKTTFGVKDFIASTGLDIPEDSPLYKYAKRELLKVEQAINRIEQERCQGDYNTTTELSILAAYPELPTGPPIVEKKESRRISEVVQQYIDENISDNNWAGGSISTFTDHLSVLIEIMEDCPLSSINYEAIRAFYDKLKIFPANRSKLKAYRDKSIAQLLKMEIPERDRLKTNTILNYFRTIKSFFNWAVGREYMNKNYAELIKIRREKAPHEEKDIFSDPELKTVFGDIAQYKGNPQRSHRYWIPLVGLYTGARLEEISQFAVDDIRQEGDVWVFDISGKVKDRKLGDKKIKTNVSKRLVPIHKALINAGLLDYHKKLRKAGEKRLFPDAKPYQKKKDGEVIEIKYGFYLGKWFSQHLKKLRVKTKDHNVSFHSLRHSFDTKAKYLDLPRDEINQIVGHVGGKGQESRYAKPYSVSRLKKTIDQIDFSG